MSPYSGFGSLSLALTWSDASITSPTIVATITRNGGIPAALAFTAGEGQATSAATLAAGYYTVNIKLYTDGARASRYSSAGRLKSCGSSRTSRPPARSMWSSIRRPSTGTAVSP